MSTLLTRQRILEAAAEVFVARGVSDTAVEHLLRAAEVSRRTFYRYFESKQAVLEGLYRLACEVLVEGIRVAIGEADGAVARVTRGIDVFLEYHATAGALIRVLHQEAMRSESPLAAHRRRVQAELVEIFDAQVYGAQGRRVDRLVFHALICALEGVSMKLLEDTPCDAASIARAREVVTVMAARVLSDADPTGTPSLPSLPEHDPRRSEP